MKFSKNIDHKHQPMIIFIRTLLIVDFKAFQIGMLQLYELGQFFQQRYRSFVKYFDPDDVNLLNF